MDDPVVGTFRDPGLPVGDRVADLLSRLTVDEKIGLLHQHQAGVPRLGLEAFRTGTEALHGVAWLGVATVFPQAVGLGATWDPELVRRVGEAVGTEVRALHHKEPERVGLNVWAPVVNPLRDPRWGRNEEGYSEDPWLTGVMGTAYARGLRGDDPRVLRTAPTLKHFLGYNNETDRSRTSSDLPPRVLHEYELPAFRAPLEAGAAVAMMASYNLVNGRPAHLSPLIRSALPEVMVVGDAGAGTNIHADQGYLPDHAAGFGAALRAGIDCFTEDDADPSPTVARLTEALDRGLISPSDVDDAARRILTVRVRLGEFDPPGADPYAATTAGVINCSAHRALAREAARRSVVLLRNEGALLPLPSSARVAVIGPLAGTVLTDWYSGTLPYAVTVRERLPGATHVEGWDRVELRTAAGVAGRFDVLDWGGGTLTFRAPDGHLRARPDGELVADSAGPGEWVVRETFEARCDGDQVRLRNVALDRWVSAGSDGVLRADAATPDEAAAFTASLVVDGPAEAAAAARDADVAVVVLGNHPMVNGRETEDRADLALPPAQEALLRAVHDANPNTVLVITSSYPYAFDVDVPAALWAAHGGQEGGSALAEILLGDAEPTGRLPQTWYRGVADLPDLLDYDIIGAEATYLYFRGEPLFPFGHGLGYTRFEHRDLRLRPAENADGLVEISVDVVNAGDRTGEDVVQLYTRRRRSRVRQPLRQLRDFRRLRLASGEHATVTFTLDVEDLACYDVARGRMVAERGRHSIMIGRSSTDITRSATLSVPGEDIPARAGLLTAATRDEEYGTRLADQTRTSGDVVEARTPDAWVCFAGVGLRPGITEARVSAATPAGGARLELRLDDPAGPLVAETDIPATGDPYVYTEVTVPAEAPAGVRDLFVILATPGMRVSTIELA
ncbi:glycoside hydrolase family 3 protein [Actinoplanes sp. NBRC 103695]|uniref:glycoside hydrolase family 3 protein n=1 Tax=Actinoplanes sp. NBRC 103695 TaxID=3032202 RepID=UPI0024A17057|nr:glycoside hydrolase family 3 protein [Actinoplanes sp. NBRC 103695]GLY92856.1 beta-glucosidase [Actinoplanes sp. NBRC 103695]